MPATRAELESRKGEEEKDQPGCFHPQEVEAELLGLSTRALLMRASDATHQHFEGGLYRLLGEAWEHGTGKIARGADGLERLIFMRCYPARSGLHWLIDATEFFGYTLQEGQSVMRFRKLR